jgi:hypothetical protein
VYKQYGHETKLVQVSETNFLPEKGQAFKISFNNDQMSKLEIQGERPKLLTKQVPKSQSQYKDDVRQLRKSPEDHLDIKLKAGTL